MFTDLVVDAVTNTKVTSAGHPFDSTSPGNMINITSGAGWTTGWYEILSVSGSTATLDRSPAAVGVTGGHGNLGGGFASPGQAASVWVSKNTMYIKNGNYTMTGSANTSGGPISLVNSSATDKLPNFIVGYNTTRTLTNTDTGPTIKAGAANQNLILNNSGGPTVVYNILFNANSNSGCTAINENNAAMRMDTCQATGFQTGFANQFAACTIINCYAKSCTAAGFTVRQSGTNMISCVADTCGSTGSTQGGFVANGVSNARYWQCLARNCQGQGFITATQSGVYINCTADNTSVGVASSGSGFKLTDLNICINCLSTNNARYGFESDQAAVNSFVALWNCAGYNNTSGTTDTNFTSGSGTNNGFVTLTAGPYTSSGTGDYSLNNTAGGGASARGAGYAQNLAGLSTASAFDIGASQHSGGGSTTLIFRGPTIVR